MSNLGENLLQTFDQNCGLCSTAIEPFNIIQAGNCGHFFCQQCLQQCLISAISDSPLTSKTCPELGCNSVFSDEQVLVIVGQEEWNKVVEAQKNEMAVLDGSYKRRPLRPNRKGTQQSSNRTLGLRSQQLGIESDLGNAEYELISDNDKQIGRDQPPEEMYSFAITDEDEVILLCFDDVASQLMKELRIKIQNGNKLPNEVVGDPVWAYSLLSPWKKPKALSDYNRYPTNVQRQLEDWYQGLKEASKGFSVLPDDDQLGIFLNTDFSSGDSLSKISLVDGASVINITSASPKDFVFKEKGEQNGETFAVIRVIESQAVKHDFDHDHFKDRQDHRLLYEKVLRGPFPQVQKARREIGELKRTLERVSFADIELNAQDCFDLIASIELNFPKLSTYKVQVSQSKKEVWICGEASLKVSRFVQRLFLKLREYRFPLNWQDKIEFAQEKTTYRQYDLEPQSLEFGLIEENFKSTVNGTIKVTRIQNLLLWSKYKTEEEVLRVKLRKPSEEILLWHGFRSIKPSTISKGEEGFDMRFAKQSGRHGAGNYFAYRASYSCAFGFCGRDEENQNPAVFLARVLIGKPAESVGRTRNAPPPLNEKNPDELYDSVLQKDVMCVVYANQKAYPQYLVTFSPNREPKNEALGRCLPLTKVEIKNSLPLQNKSRTEYLLEAQKVIST